MGDALPCEGCVVIAAGGKVFDVVVDFDEDEITVFIGFESNPGGLCPGTTAGFGGASLPERHICRAEVLRTYTWRQLCAASAPASQN